MNQPLVSIITINYRQAQITCDLLDSLALIDYPNYEIFLVDNGSLKDETTRFQQHHSQVKVINEKENLGFAGANNVAIKRASGAYILLLNNDTIVPPGFLQGMVNVMKKHTDAGIVSPKIYFYDSPNKLQYAGTGSINFKTGRGDDPANNAEDYGQYNQVKNVELAHGACMLIRKEVFESIGLLSEVYFLYYEELDFCQRTRQNSWKIYFTPDSYIHHRESSSVGKFSPLKTHFMFRNRWLFMKKFGGSSYWMFLTYFLFVSVPLNIIRFSLKGEWEHVKAVWNGVVWNLGAGANPKSNPKSNIKPRTDRTPNIEQSTQHIEHRT